MCLYSGLKMISMAVGILLMSHVGKLWLLYVCCDSKQMGAKLCYVQFVSDQVPHYS